MGGPLFVLRVFCLYVSVCLVSHYQVITFQQAEKINGGAKKANEERHLRASIILPINSLKMAKIILLFPVRCVAIPWE